LKGCIANLPLGFFITAHTFKERGKQDRFRLSPESLLNRHADIVRHLRHGQSVRHAGKISGKGFSTVQRVKKILDQHRLPLNAAAI
jgi:hypothetical protein